MLTIFAVIAPLMFPNPMAIPSVTLRLYDPSTLLATHALQLQVSGLLETMKFCPTQS